jgi:pimeloyl-ACP methyl ester carboxylesterase
MALLSQHGYDAAAKHSDHWKQIEDAVSSTLPWNDTMRGILRRLTSRPNPPRAYGWNATATFTAKDDLSAVACPTLVLHGQSDMLIPIRVGELIHKAVVHSQWRPMAGGHNFPIDNERAFLDVLGGFLSSLPV